MHFLLPFHLSASPCSSGNVTEEPRPRQEFLAGESPSGKQPSCVSPSALRSRLCDRLRARSIPECLKEQNKTKTERLLGQRGLLGALTVPSKGAASQQPFLPSALPVSYTVTQRESFCQMLPYSVLPTWEVLRPLQYILQELVVMLRIKLGNSRKGGCLLLKEAGSCGFYPQFC